MTGAVAASVNRESGELVGSPFPGLAGGESLLELFMCTRARMRGQG